MAETTRRDLRRRILRAIGRWPFDPIQTEKSFNRLALDVFRYQAETGSVYRRFCRLTGVKASSVRDWKSIPAIPVGAFRQARVGSFYGTARGFFQTSGTTGYSRGRHYYADLSLYEESLSRAFVRLALDGQNPKTFRYFFLIRSPQSAPHSSLSYMMGVLNRRMAGAKGRFYYANDQIALARLQRDLRRCRKKVILFTTTQTLLELVIVLKKHKQALKLVPGSRFFETGGLKTIKPAVGRRRLDELCRRFLSLGPADRIEEFGMTELFSQYYRTRRSGGFFRGPPWARCVVRGRADSREVPNGRTGVLTFYDLANLDSAVAVETADLGILRGKGFDYRGRIPHAKPRGCSLDYRGLGA